MSKNNRCNSETADAPILQHNADSNMQGTIGSFQALQLQSKTLLRQCTEIQRTMQDNRQNRLLAQRQVSENGRFLSRCSHDPKQSGVYADQLVKLRQQIALLETQHVSLHQQFISLQSQIREVVRFQRCRLEETISSTRALGSTQFKYQSGACAPTPENQYIDYGSGSNDEQDPTHESQVA